MPDKKGSNNLFKRLTRLFRSGPVVKRKVRTIDTTVAMPDKTKSSAVQLFQRSLGPTYSHITSNAYNMQERMSRYQDFNEMEYSVSGDTQIATPEGFRRIDDLAKECSETNEGCCDHNQGCNDNQFWVYSYDHNKKQLVLALGKQARQTRVDHAWKVTFDNGQSIVGSANHRLMLRDGSYRMIEDLRPGDAMMPFYNRHDKNGYRYIYTMNKAETSSGWQSEHRLVAEQAILYRKLEKGEVVHHVNFCRNNNVPSNLQVMTEEEHQLLHRENIERLNEQKWSPENSKWIDEFRRQQSLMMRRQNPMAKDDIRFEHVLNAAEKTGFVLKAVCDELNVSQTLVMSRLNEQGFQQFTTFAQAYEGNTTRIVQTERTLLKVGINDLTLEMIKGVITEPDTKLTLASKLGCTSNIIDKFLMTRHNTSWLDLRKSLGWTVDNRTGGRPRKLYDKSNPEYQLICNTYQQGMSLSRLIQGTKLTSSKVMKHVHNVGFKNFKTWTEGYQNHKVVSIEYAGVMPLYDLTVDGYKNFATDTVISHNTAEINSAMDIYSDETVAQDEKGRTLHVYSNNPKIKSLLEDLLYNTLNVEFNLRPWTRNLVKYGDAFFYNDVSQQHGVINMIPIPVNEIEREEGYDKDDPMAYRFRWVTLGNKVLENWEVTHMRLLGNDMFLPYGSSVLEGARRIWRQLILIEDAMLVYRIVRSPERRVFYIDVGNTPTDEIPHYLEQAKATLRSQQVIDKNTGRVDLRYNPLCLSMNTGIKLQDGRLLRLDELINEWNSGKQDQWVYSIDPVNKCPVPGKVIWAGMTRKDAELVRVHLDDGSYVDTTPDHKWMLRDGTYQEASLLEPGQSLMPLYTKLTTKEDGHKIVGYEKVYDPFSGEFVLTHRNNVTATLGANAIRGKVVHHVDFNKLNNSPDNLKPMTWGEHQKLHADICVQYNQSSIGRKNSSKRMKKTWEEGGIAPSTFVELWKDDDVRAKRVGKLTLDTGDRFIEQCLQVLDHVGTGLSTREAAFLNAANTSKSLTGYLQELNPSFKNGFNDKLTRSSLQSRLKTHGLPKALEDLKRLWADTRIGADKVVQFCNDNPSSTRNDVLRHFNITRATYSYLVRQVASTETEFSRQYLRGNSRYVSSRDIVGYMNHKVVRIERLEQHEDTGCITVEKYRNFAACGTSSDGLGLAPNSLIYLHNSVDEDYFIAVRGNETGTKIDTLQGGQNTAAVEDVQYIQNKLFAALKVPKAYLGYTEMLSSKATLAQEDIRFSRTVNMIQRTIISELNKAAIIHLYANGWEGDDLLNFTLRLSNPSTVAQQQKLELFRTKFEIAGTAPEGLLSRDFLRRTVLGLTDEEIIQIERELLEDAAGAQAREAAEAGGSGGGGGGGGGGGPSGGGLPPPGGEEGGLGEPGGIEGGPGGEAPPLGGDQTGAVEPPPEEEELPPENAGEFGTDNVILDNDDPEPFGEPIRLSMKDENAPIKVQTQLQRTLYNRGRRRTHGASKTHMPDFNKMTGNNSREMKDPYDREWLRSAVKNPLADTHTEAYRGNIPTLSPSLTKDVTEMLGRMAKRFGRALDVGGSSPLITEAIDEIDDIDVLIEDDGAEE